MHIEYFAYLLRALKQDSAQRRAQPVSFEVTDCKEDHGFLLTSNLAFKLKRASEDSPFSALEIAERIVAAANQVEVEYFTVQAGGLGFINANPNKKFLVEFYRWLVETKGACLFHEQSLVVFPVVSPPPFTSDRIAFSWPLSWGKILKGKACQEPDILNFVDHLRSKKAEISFNEQLMLLALIACPELEVKPFLQGLKGRQNIPWYLEKMRVDLEMCRSALAAMPQEKNCQQLGLIKEFFDTSYLNVVLNQLLLFRNRLFHWKRTGNPGQLIVLLLQIAQDFYAFYHLPQTRHFLASSRASSLSFRSGSLPLKPVCFEGDAEYLVQLSQVLEILQHVTHHVLVSLQHACMRGELALQLQQDIIARETRG